VGAGDQLSMTIGMEETVISAIKIEGMGSLTWAFLLMGVLRGLAQWLVLCRYISGFGWWILDTAIGTALASCIDALILHEVTNISSDTFCAWSFEGPGFGVGAFAGIVMGFAMMLLSL
jgi:hypothetical protein